MTTRLEPAPWLECGRWGSRTGVPAQPVHAPWHRAPHLHDEDARKPRFPPAAAKLKAVDGSLMSPGRSADSTARPPQTAYAGAPLGSRSVRTASPGTRAGLGLAGFRPTGRTCRACTVTPVRLRRSSGRPASSLCPKSDGMSPAPSWHAVGTDCMQSLGPRLVPPYLQLGLCTPPTALARQRQAGVPPPGIHAALRHEINSANSY